MDDVESQPQQSESAPPCVLVIGAGPTGLETAIALAQAGLNVTVVERGDTVGAAVRDWGHWYACVLA